MIRHIVFLKMNETATDDDRDKLVSALKGLTGKIPLIKELEVGIDIGKKPNSFDIALNTLFETLDDVETYIKDPEHVKVVELIKSVCFETCKTDYEV